MPTKKPVKSSKPTQPSKKNILETKAKKLVKDLEKKAKMVEKETKVVSKKVESRRHKASTEEKIFTIMWIIAIIRGLSILFKNGRRLFISMLLIIIGILLVTGFFTKKQ